MNRSSRPEVLDLQQKTAASFNRARSKSISSLENPLSSNGSTASLSTNPLLNVCPEPAYIAPSAAARLVTSDHEGFFKSLHQDGIVGPETPTMYVTQESLKLVNQFLDFLLYSFLSTAKSTSLASLRPAVSEVLRLRLAKEAVAGADQELQSYLGSDEETDVLDVYDGQSASGEWGLGTAWRKARVQCMVYSSLGDLEEDDEAFYTENGLEGSVGLQQYQSHSGIAGAVSPAVAIWLTSILEFIGEQTLLVAGHATIARYSAQRIAAAARDDMKSDGTFPDKPIIEELDTEKVALNPSLGRMWRQWRKKIRGGRGSISIPHDVVIRQERTESIDTRASIGSDYASHDESNKPQIEDDSRTVQVDLVQAGNLRAAISYKDTSLTPIIEHTSPLAELPLENQTENLQADNDQKTILKDRKRPQSLILLPWTTESPFTMSPGTVVIRRPCSLPDLRKGDFADPCTEGKDDFEGDQTTDIEDENIEVQLSDEGDIESIESDRECLDPEAMLKRQDNSNIPAQAQCIKVPNVGQSHSPKMDSELHCSHETKTAGNPKDNQPIEVIAICAEQHGFHNNESIEITGESQSSHSHLTDQLGIVGEATGLSQNRSTEENISKHIYELEMNETMRNIDSQSPTELQYRDKLSSQQDNTTELTKREQMKDTSHLKQLSSSSKNSQISDRKIGQLTLVPTSSSVHSISSDRGPGVRVFTPPATPDHSRRSSSFSKAQRPIHTSGSTSSQTSNKLKSFISWTNESGKHIKVQESDSESRSSLHSDRLASLDDKERSFEELISGGGTIHCTITPDPIRNMTLHDTLPQELPEKRAPTADLADFLKNTSPEQTWVPDSISPRPRPISPRLPLTRSASREIRVTDNAHIDRTPKHLEGIPQSTTISSKGQQIGSDFENSGGGQSPGIGKFGVPLPVGLPGLPAVIRQTRTESPIASARAKNRLLAREASGSTGSDTTSALADFFRNTKPPINGEDFTSHRISRSVAPFRNTMDSTQFDANGEVGHTEELNKDPSFTPSSALQESYQSSFNSSTALLRNNSKKNHDYGGTSGVTSPEVKRKQVRQRDPYAIDMEGEDDEGEDDMLDLVLPKKREEESLIDFLKNAPPPPPATQIYSEDSNKIVQKKSSSISLISRFGRNSSRKNSIASNADKIPIIQQGSNPKYIPLRIDNDNTNTNAEASDIHRRPPGSAARANFDAHYPATSSRMNPHNSNRLAQARGGKTERNDTDSLADFLKHTAPPSDHHPSASHPQKEGSKSMFKKISLSRSKKSNELAGVV